MNTDSTSSQRFVDAPLPPEVHRRMVKFADEQDVPLPAVLLAAWQVFLRQLTGRAGLAIVMLVSGGSVGAVDNELQLVTDETAFEEHKKFGHYVKSLWSGHHYALHFEEPLAPARSAGDPSPSPTPFGFVYGGKGVPAPGTGMTLECDETGTTLGTTIRYDLQVFSPVAAEQILHRYHRILRDGMEHPDIGVNVLGILEKEEQGSGIDPEHGPAAVIEDRTGAPGWKSLLPIQPRGTNPPLFCACGGGGNLLSLESLARHLGNDQPLFGLQSQGLNGSARYATVEDLAAHYLKDIREFQLEGPYLLEGMSFGGLVALEMAQQLTRQGKKVALLALLDTAPKGFQKTFGVESARRKAEWSLSEFLALERHEKRVFVQRRIGEYGRKLFDFPADPLTETSYVDGTKNEQAIPSIREANRRASERYVSRPYHDRVTIFLARQSFVTATHRFRMGWNLLAPDALEMHVVPGTHISMFEEPHVRTLAKEINECIRRALLRS